MRIGHYAHDLTANGGIQQYVRRLAAAQQSAGHTVQLFSRVMSPDVILSPSGVALVEVAGAAGVDVLDVHELPSDGVPPARLPVVRTVHGHEPYCPSGGRYLARPGTPCDRVHGAVVCTWGHLWDRCGSIRPGRLLIDMRRPSVERRSFIGREVIAVSEFVRNALLREGYDGDKVTTVQHATPNHAPQWTGHRDRFVYGGRLTAKKGVEWLLRSHASMLPAIPLSIAGSGPDETRLRTLTRDLGSADLVTFHGWMAGPSLQQLMSSAIAVIVPSVWHEPAGLVAIESMAVGTPVIASRVGGLVETMEATGGGLTVEANDVEGLARAMSSLHEDSSLALRLGRLGQQNLDHRTSQRHADAVADVYQRSLNVDD